MVQPIGRFDKVFWSVFIIGGFVILLCYARYRAETHKCCPNASYMGFCGICEGYHFGEPNDESFAIEESNDEEICAYIEGGWPEDWESRLNGIWLTIGPKKGIPDEWIINFEDTNEPDINCVTYDFNEPNESVDNYFTLKRRNQHKLTVKVNEPYFQAHFERYFPGVGVPDDLNKGNEYGEPRLVLDIAILLLEQRIKALESKSYDPNDPIYKFIPEADPSWIKEFGDNERTRLLHTISELRFVVAMQGKRMMELEQWLKTQYGLDELYSDPNEVKE
jgi:hypothetical protein